MKLSDISKNAISQYQKYISFDFNTQRDSHCMYYPSCSSYGKDSFVSGDLKEGFNKTFYRLNRCVPELKYKQILEFIKDINTHKLEDLNTFIEFSDIESRDLIKQYLELQKRQNSLTAQHLGQIIYDFPDFSKNDKSCKTGDKKPLQETSKSQYEEQIENLLRQKGYKEESIEAFITDLKDLQKEKSELLNKLNIYTIDFPIAASSKDKLALEGYECLKLSEMTYHSILTNTISPITGGIVNNVIQANNKVPIAYKKFKIAKREEKPPFTEPNYNIIDRNILKVSKFVGRVFGGLAGGSVGMAFGALLGGKLAKVTAFNSLDSYNKEIAASYGQDTVYGMAKIEKAAGSISYKIFNSVTNKLHNEYIAKFLASLAGVPFGAIVGSAGGFMYGAKEGAHMGGLYVQNLVKDKILHLPQNKEIADQSEHKS